MTKLINKDKLDIFTNKLWERITKSFVSKTLPNTVTGETMITDGYVGGESTVTKRHNETRANMSFLNSNTSFYGIPSLSVPARTYIDKIICIMDDSAGDIGENATGVNVGVVSKSTGRILEYLKRNQTETIIANPLTSGSHALTGNKAISISINRAWQEEVYFIVGAMKMMAGYIDSLTPSVGGDNLREVGDNLGNGTGGNYIGRMVIYTSKYSLNEVATKALSIDDIKNDYVSKTKENLVTGKTTLTNGWLIDNALSVINNTNAVHTISDNTSWCGTPNLNVAANTYVSYICIAVNDNFDIGREINNIKIGVVKNNGNRVHEIIAREGKATVVKNTMGNIDSSKIIMYPIRKSFSEQVYFIAGFNGMKWGNRSGNWQTVRPNIPFPDVDRVLEINNGNYVPQYFLLSDGIPLNNIMPLINTKANLSNDNTFSGANRFDGSVRLNENVDIRYVTKYEQLLLGGDSTRGSDWAVYLDRDIYIPAGSYVTYLDIRVTDDVGVGTELSDIYIYEVQRGDNIRNDSIVGLPNNLRFRIFDVDGYGKCIRVQFNRKFDRDTYCIIGQKMANGKILMGNDTKGDIRRAITGKPFVLNYSHNVLSESRPTNNKVIHRYNIERVGILQDDIKNINNVLATTVKNTDVGNEANKIPIIGADGRLPSSILPPEQNGGVRTVNGISPVDGNVTVLAEHIKYHADTDITIKRAIDNKVNEADTVTSSQAHKIVKLDGSGKINDNMMPLTVAKRINNLDVNNNAVTIYSDNIAIDSSNPNKNIKQALDERAHKNQDNTFTKHNRFNDYSPTVHRLFARKHINSDINPDNVAVYNANTYFAPLNEKYTERNKYITHVLLPIKGANVGDSISINYFIYNNNGTVIYQQNWAKNYTVIDEEVAGCKCAKIDVNRDSGNNGIGFGFVVFTSNVGGRPVGAACLKSAIGADVSWTSTTGPRVDQNLNSMSKTKFPYKICYETTSEVVTRFELEQVTQMYPKTLIGEYKNISYDAGDVLEESGHTWIKANGQSIYKEDYPDLYEKFNSTRTINEDIEITIPLIENQIGYYYICAKIN